MSKIFIITFLISTNLFSAPLILKVEADNSYPPYSYSENGKLKGIYVDIINLINNSQKEFQIKQR